MLKSCLYSALSICISFIITGNAQAQTDSKIVAALPSIICLLICDDEALEIPPAIEDQQASLSYFRTVQITTLSFANSGGTNITNCTSAPTLPAGLSVQISANTNSCEIVGTPNAISGAQLFTITATNEFGSNTATVTISVAEPVFTTVSGQITYDRVPTAVSPSRLDYNNISAEPVRGATIEILNSGGSAIGTTTTDGTGNYSYTLNTDAQVRLRVRAELLKTTGSSRYNVKIIDNTSGDALYTLAEGSVSLASTNPIRNLHAPSGWGGSSYTSTRASAPFAMLDSAYESITDFIAVDNNVVFPPLLINWSVGNVPISGDRALGQIGTSFYSAGNIFILGAANNDTDEFDDHVMIHEWGHYFEDKLSRSDSIGGPHSGGQRLDMRVAFGEGFGNALSAIITDDPLYIDTSGLSQATGFSINVENNANGSTAGWFNESSVQSLLYDFYDSTNDGIDTVSLGLAPIYNVLINEQKNNAAFTSIFSFSEALKANNSANASGISALLNSQAITGGTIEKFASTETNNGNSANDVLPIYTDLSNTVNVCTITAHGTPNKLSNHRYLKFDLAIGSVYTITATKTSAVYGNTDPDFVVYQNGVLKINAFSGTVDTETSTTSLNAGTHVMAFTDYNTSIGASGKACFDVSISITNN